MEVDEEEEECDLNEERQQNPMREGRRSTDSKDTPP